MKLQLLTLCCSLLLLSSGCQSGLSVPDSMPAEEKIRRADALLLDAAGPTAGQRLLTAARFYNAGQAYAKARDALNRIDIAALPANQRHDFLNAIMDASVGLGDLDGALQASAPGGRYAFVSALEPGEASQLAMRRADLFERRNQPVAAIRERAAARALPATQQQANDEALWAALMRLAREPLRQLENDADPALQAWAVLARLVRESGDSPSLLASRINTWMLEHPDHPAAERPPVAVRQAMSVKTGDGPVQIAVLLPQHGKLADAGTAVERGLLAAWFQAGEAGVRVPLLRFYDSSVSDFSTLYETAVRDGAQLVIGPLEKEHLKALQSLGRLPVTTIALNYPDAPGGPAALNYFGLAGEDEADQIAKAALAAGKRRAAALVPAGEWGERMAAQLARTMAAGGGELRATGVFQGNGDYSNVVRNLMELANSEIRHDRVERASGLKLGFEPQRRQDIDCLFIVGNTLQGTQLVPVVQYHHAGDLPLYATSHINGQITPGAIRDLAGIRFVEMPWIVDAAQPLRQRIGAAWKDIDERYLRLYALGVDTWRLAMQLPAAGSEISGATGALSMGEGRQIHRRLEWQIYRNGNAEPLDAPPP